MYQPGIMLHLKLTESYSFNLVKRFILIKKGDWEVRVNGKLSNFVVTFLPIIIPNILVRKKKKLQQTVHRQDETLWN